MKVTGLFSGIGGLELGLHRSGHRTLLMAENDVAASAVLSSRIPDVENFGDVRGLRSLPSETEVLVGGFPCQDLSQAGMTKGITGAKSSIVAEAFRLLRRKRVPFVLLENVPFMLQLSRGEAMRHVVTAIEELGYRWAYRVIDSRSFGIPQRRERVFLLASSEVDPAALLFAEDAVNPPETTTTNKAFGFYWTEGLRGLGWAVDAVPTLKGGSTLGIPSPPAIWLPDGRIVTPDIQDAERLQGFDAGWTSPVAEVVRDSYRWKLVGNAVSVHTAEWLGRMLKKKGKAAVRPRIPLPTTGAWPKAAWGDRQGRYAAAVSPWPVSKPQQSLAEFLQYEPKLLSLRATEGFMRRLERSGLRYPREFWISLTRHVERMGGGRQLSLRVAS